MTLIKIYFTPADFSFFFLSFGSFMMRNGITACWQQFSTPADSKRFYCYCCVYVRTRCFFLFSSPHMILSRLMYVFIIYLILFVTARTFLGYASHSTWKCHSHLCLYLSSSVVAISKIALWALVTLTSHQGTRHDIFFPPHLKCCKLQLYEKCAQWCMARAK